nr:threonine/serine exporter family protein [Fusobacterium sp.]
MDFLELNYLEVLYSFLATFFFSIIFNLRGKKLFYSSTCGALGWFTYLLASQFYNKTASYFIAAMIITIYSEIFAKRNRSTVTTTLIPGLIPLVPGSGIYYTMSYFVDRNISKAADMG